MVEDNNSLKRCIVQTPVSIPKISKIIEGFVESIAENPLKENKINTGSSILSNEKYEPLETNNLSNSCYEINQEVIVLEFQTRKKKMLDQTNLNKLLQKPSKHGSN